MRYKPYNANYIEVKDDSGTYYLPIGKFLELMDKQKNQATTLDSYPYIYNDKKFKEFKELYPELLI